IYDELLDIGDVSGKRIVTTQLRGSVTVREENGAAALEVMRRFAVKPKWLIYLPPTRSPCETSGRTDYLECPTEALAYYRRQGVDRVICEEKHMGSRAIIVLCRNNDVARRRFGIRGDEHGCIYTRTGRAFFSEKSREQYILEQLAQAAEDGGIWDLLESDW